MLNRMNVTSHIPLIVVKQNCMDLHHDNWTSVMKYMAEVFPQKREDTKRKGRFIYEANVHGHGGHERAAGRGNGRGGHGCESRGGHGWGHWFDPNAYRDIPKDINGVNTMHIFCDFSQDEWSALIEGRGGRERRGGRGGRWKEEEEE